MAPRANMIAMVRIGEYLLGFMIAAFPQDWVRERTVESSEDYEFSLSISFLAVRRRAYCFLS
jgi:hypothetical protein